MRPGASARGAGAVVGIDVGGTKVAAAAVQGVTIANRVERPTETRSAEALLDEIAELARAAATEAGGLRAVGAGIPSQIDAASGTALASVNIPLTGVPVRDELGKRLGVPVYVDNDANCAALAEAQLVPDPPAHELVMLTLGTGVGGGIVIDGRIFRGATGLGAELGHIVVDGREPTELPAGELPRPGSLEWHCSGRGLAREATSCAERHPDSELGRLARERGRVSGLDAVAVARAGDGPALELMEGYGRWLGIGIATVVNVFEPTRVVIGGGLSQAADLFLEAAVAEAARWALPELWKRTTVGLARGGADAGLIGAAVLAVHELERKGHTAG